jgi:hypothetical protein
MTNPQHRFAHDLPVDQWGASVGWPMFHAAAEAAPDNLEVHPGERRRLAAFYTNFGHGLPCSDCRAHYARQYAESPADVRSRVLLRIWAVAFHNGVNRRLGKPELPTTKALQYWERRFPGHAAAAALPWWRRAWAQYGWALVPRALLVALVACEATRSESLSSSSTGLGTPSAVGESALGSFLLLG